MYCQHGHMFARYVSIFQPLKNVIDMLNIAIFSESWHFIQPLCVNMLNTALFYVCWYFIQFSTAHQFADNHVLVCQYFIPPTLVWPCSMYVGILFGLSMAMFYVYVVLWGGYQYVSSNGTTMFYLCWYFIQSQYVGMLSTAMFYLCWYFIWSQYVGTSSTAMFYMVYVGILFRPSHVSTFCMAMFYV